MSENKPPNQQPPPPSQQPKKELPPVTPQPYQYSSWSYKRCEHPAIKPIIIGGYEVRLGACRDIPASVVESMDLILPLNGDVPAASFGRLLPIIKCELPDRGGVPKKWPLFINEIARYIRKGHRVLAYCMGGHGRTGTFGASLISVMEPEEPDPIMAIRERHCIEAVESLKQAKAVFALRGQRLPKEYVEEFTPVVQSYKWSPPPSGHSTGKVDGVSTNNYGGENPWDRYEPSYHRYTDAEWEEYLRQEAEKRKATTQEEAPPITPQSDDDIPF